MTDFKETRASQEATKPQEKTDSSTSSVIQSSMRGDVGGQADTPQHQPKDDKKLGTHHAGDKFETPPPVEAQPETIQLGNEGQAEGSEETKSSEGKRGSLEAPDNYNPRGIEG